MRGQDKVYDVLKELGIGYDYLEHPAAPTIELAMQYCNHVDSTHCKNLFLRNHKGNQHYLVIFHCERSLAVHELEIEARQIEFCIGAANGEVSWVETGFRESFRAVE